MAEDLFVFSLHTITTPENDQSEGVAFYIVLALIFGVMIRRRNRDGKENVKLDFAHVRNTLFAILQKHQLMFRVDNSWLVRVNIDFVAKMVDGKERYYLRHHPNDA